VSRIERGRIVVGELWQSGDEGLMLLCLDGLSRTWSLLKESRKLKSGGDLHESGPVQWTDLKQCSKSLWI
jgi:hypothetical protein